jgi:hypothetical protein
VPVGTEKLRQALVGGEARIRAKRGPAKAN